MRGPVRQEVVMTGAILACLALIAVASTIAFYGLIVWDRIKEKKTPPDAATSEGNEQKEEN